MALQAVGIGWLALESSTTLPYARLIAPFVISGLGMGLFFAPMARLTLSYAPRHLEGVASGTSNALRQLGTVFGIAVLGSIFAAYGGYETVDAFVAGVVPAMKVGAVVLAAGVVLILLAPVRRHAVESVEESGDVAGRDIKEPADAVAVLEPAGR
jgi:MFS family permease